MVLLKNFVNVFLIPELRKKLLFTVGIVLVIFRLGSYIPVVGIDVKALQLMMSQASGLGGLFSYIDLLSGGSIKDCSIFALGIMPYISASIMMQILSLTVPSLEQLGKEGEYGRKMINQYTRYLALGVAIFQSTGLAYILQAKGLVIHPGWGFRLTFIMSMAVGSMFVMWLGEQISLFGIGNGSSMIIFAGIVDRFPGDFSRIIWQISHGLMSVWLALFMLVLLIVITGCIVYLERGERKIPVQYARRVVGQRVYGGQSTYIPFKINIPGVMPVIFAGAVLSAFQFLFAMLSSRLPGVALFAESFGRTSVIWNGLEFFLIIFFSYFYTSLIYNPDELADNIKKNNGFIPGVRPGRKTAEFFNYILVRIGLIGAIYLAILALLPNIIAMLFEIPFPVTGTGLLIVVGVALELSSQIESYLIEHRYEGFLSTGRVRRGGSR